MNSPPLSSRASQNKTFFPRLCLGLGGLVLATLVGCDDTGGQTTGQRTGAPASSVDLPTQWSNELGMHFARIPAGEFQHAGSTETTPPTRIGRAYLIASHEVTVGQFQSFVQSTGYLTDAETDEIRGGFGWTEGGIRQSEDFSWRETGFPQSPDHPVVNVSWNDAVAFARWLSEQDGHHYRLPTEAEWEHACRATAVSRFSLGDSYTQIAGHANIADNALKEILPSLKTDMQVSDNFAFTAPVRSLAPNDWGIHDMHGNVMEWCQDWWDTPSSLGGKLNPTGPESGSFKVVRGGGWSSPAIQATASTRLGLPPHLRDCTCGFRLVVELDITPSPASSKLP